MLMSEIDAKEYLMQIKRYDETINSRQADLDYLKSLVTKVTPTLKQDVVSTSGGNLKFEDAMARNIGHDNISMVMSFFSTNHFGCSLQNAVHTDCSGQAWAASTFKSAAYCRLQQME